MTDLCGLLVVVLLDCILRNVLTIDRAVRSHVKHRSSCIRFLCVDDATFRESLLNLFRHDWRSDEPWRNDVDPHAHARHSSAHRTHDTSYTPFAGAILRRTGLIQITGKTGRHDKYSIVTFWVAI